jgi:broad specificity phosphatase PhoE
MDERGLEGGIRDLVPLTVRGVQQAAAAAEGLAPMGATRILASPATPALQTAATIALHLRLPVDVRFDLREWVPDSSYRWTREVLEQAVSEYRANHGEWPADGPRRWEMTHALRSRAIRALRVVEDAPGPTIVVAHEVLICAVSGRQRVGLCEIVPVETAHLIAGPRKNG